MRPMTTTTTEDRLDRPRCWGLAVVQFIDTCIFKFQLSGFPTLWRSCHDYERSNYRDIRYCGTLTSQHELASPSYRFFYKWNRILQPVKSLNKKDWSMFCTCLGTCLRANFAGSAKLDDLFVREKLLRCHYCFQSFFVACKLACHLDS